VISAAQIRAARGLLAISQSELAESAAVGVATIRRIEASSGELKVTVQTLLRLQRALESAGVVFIDHDEKLGPGVRLKCRID